MAHCGIARIDALFGDSGDAIAAGDADAAAVGALQDLLIGHGFRLPGPLGAGRGSYGPQTTRCVAEFQRRCGLPATGTVDTPTLRALVERPSTNAVASQGYLALVLDVQFEGMTRLMCLTTQFEGAGRFGAINRNTDRAGLSFGLIQWAQKPGRLAELLRAFDAAAHDPFVRILGSGDAELARRLVAHTGRPRGGTDANGVTTDPAFDLVAEPWLGRFREAAMHPALQRVQVDAAVAAFEASLARLRQHAPQLQTEREIAFMLDLANQHGDAGARSIFVAAGPDLAALADESVRRVKAQFGSASAEAAATRARRDAFRTSGLLRDTPFA
jgi:peptidoglycan hydrolase-like protein with peptidoglycan-binding domain